MAEWKESEHPRASDGRFGDKAGESTPEETRRFKELLGETEPYTKEDLRKDEQQGTQYEAYTEDMFSAMITDASKTVNFVERACISAYVGDEYKEINKCMREGIGCDDVSYSSGLPIQLGSYREIAKVMSKAIARYELKQDITVYRGVIGDYAKQLLDGATVGKLMVLDGFSSTGTETVSDDFAFSDDGDDALIMQINVPKGKGLGMPVNLNMEARQGENEFLLQRDSKVKITAIGHTENGKRMITMEVVPPQPKAASKPKYQQGQSIQSKDGRKWSVMGIEPNGEVRVENSYGIEVWLDPKTKKVIR
ncbi:MAG: hypothetical protein FWD76_06245 [Firmicutes bacterium]|nr:hypothetical protein [Bacillota bacterium]